MVDAVWNTNPVATDLVFHLLRRPCLGVFKIVVFLLLKAGWLLPSDPCCPTKTGSLQTPQRPEQPTSVAEAAGRTRRSLLGPQRLSGERGGVYWGRRGCREARVELLVAEEAVWVAGPKGRRTARSQLDPENCGSAQDRGVFVPAVGTSVSPHTEVLGRWIGSVVPGELCCWSWDCASWPWLFITVMT